ncbi:MarC family integral membrane protein [Bacillus altitudinis]|nr:MarC family integral membrane protein [Bacillus altitudinis]
MISFMIHVIVSLFAVSNPIGNVPLFITLTEGYSEKERAQTAKQKSDCCVFYDFDCLSFGRQAHFQIVWH